MTKSDTYILPSFYPHRYTGILVNWQPTKFRTPFDKLQKEGYGSYAEYDIPYLEAMKSLPITDADDYYYWHVIDQFLPPSLCFVIRRLRKMFELEPAIILQERVVRRYTEHYSYRTSHAHTRHAFTIVPEFVLLYRHDDEVSLRLAVTNLLIGFSYALKNYKLVMLGNSRHTFNGVEFMASLYAIEREKNKEVRYE